MENYKEISTEDDTQMTQFLILCSNLTKIHSAKNRIQSWCEAGKPIRHYIGPLQLQINDKKYDIPHDETLLTELCECLKRCEQRIAEAINQYHLTSTEIEKTL